MQVGALLAGELADRLAEEAVEETGARRVDSLPARGEPMVYGTARTGNALDKVTLDHPGGEGAHRLVGLERELGEGVQ